MKKVAIIHLNEENTQKTVSFLDQDIEINYLGCGGDPDRAAALIAENDGQVDAIGLEGMPSRLQLGGAKSSHEIGQNLKGHAKQTPIVDGGGIRDSMERWSMILANRQQPGIFSRKRVLMVPGLNHNGLARSLARHKAAVHYADPVVYFALPDFPGMGSEQARDQMAGPTLAQLQTAPFRRLFPQAGEPGIPRMPQPFDWADILAGDIGAIRRYAPQKLRGKTVIVESASEEDVADLAARGVNILVTILPALEPDHDLACCSATTLEALLAALRPDPDLPLNEDTYLDLMAAIEWQPGIRYLQPEEANINRFAFVIHPLNIKFLHNHPDFRWTRYLPDSLVEKVAAWIPPIYISRITGGESPTTGQKIEGYLYSLGATPREMLRHNERFTYTRLKSAARMAERRGARLMGLGAFTSVVGDAGITVANESDIAITSGNSLTVAATLEAAKQAVIQMGVTDLTKGRAMVIGATGSIGSVCSRLLAQAIFDVVLVSIEPERLIELKRTIQAETPQATVSIALKADDLVEDCDLIVTATSAFGQRILDITKCKPGAVVCDVARPLDINPAEAALRPDVLVIESGEVLIPGDIDFGYNIGLPPKTSYACLAETALLAMEGRFEDYTLGRDINIDRVKEIYRLFKKHGFELAGLRTFGDYITEEDVAQKQIIAQKLRDDPALLARTKAEAAEKLAEIPVMAKGISAGQTDRKTLFWLAGLVGAVGVIAGLLNLKRRK